MSRAAPLDRALALDLGSTRIKAARHGLSAGLTGLLAIPAPPLRGDDGIREGDPQQTRSAIETLLRKVAADAPQGTRVGVASQRSTFLLWRRRDGQPVTPLISWQDRRAAAWCEEQRPLADVIADTTGLVLSAHYVGPKLATLQRSNPELRRALHGGELLFGNLDAWLGWCWSGGAVHETDLTMAARTLMVDLAAGDWSPKLLRLYDVPLAALPHIVATVRKPRALPGFGGGLGWTASLADQAAGTLAVLDPRESTALVTLGTGAFVMRPLAGPSARRSGYLTAPIFGGPDGNVRWALEGSINGAAAALDRYGPLPDDFAFPTTDDAPAAFCIPDAAGLGAPHWRPDVGLTMNAAAERDERSLRLVVREGLIFRIREVLDDLCPAGADRILLSGGVANDPGVGPGIAAALERPVELLTEPEAGLVGVGRLAAGLDPFAAPRTRIIDPPANGQWLAAKYPRWRAWLRSALERDQGRKRSNRNGSDTSMR